MENQDQQVIQGLFTRLGEVERQAPPRDADAEAFIKQRIAQQPSAPYFMAQTIVMQEFALQQAQQKIEDLERQAQQRSGGGLFGGLFGGGQNSQQPGRALASNPRAAAPMQPGQGGGFLAGAAQTAMGVAGGVLLGSAIASMFSSDAKASEAAPAEPVDEPAAHEDDSGFDDSLGGGEF